MKYLVLLLLLNSIPASSQTNFPYSVGEYTSYKISFGKIWVGHAELSVNGIQKISDRASFHIIGRGRTAPFFDFFFKVRDVYETFIDTATLLPLAFNRDVNEGGYLINQNYKFNHNEGRVLTQDSTIVIPPNTQDMLSAFFYARTFKKDSITTSGNSFHIPIFMDNENYFLEIKYLGNEVLTTNWGKIDCMIFQPKMQEGRVFENGEKMKIWVSDDYNHLLMKVETVIWAGTISAILNEYKSIKYPFSIIGE